MLYHWLGETYRQNFSKWELFLSQQILQKQVWFQRLRKASHSFPTLVFLSLSTGIMSEYTFTEAYRWIKLHKGKYRCILRYLYLQSSIWNFWLSYEVRRWKNCLVDAKANGQLKLGTIVQLWFELGWINGTDPWGCYFMAIGTQNIRHPSMEMICSMDLQAPEWVSSLFKHVVPTVSPWWSKPID